MTIPSETEEAVADRADKISEVLARQIVRDLAREPLSSGTMLPPEAVMLRRLQVGRASLREALRILEVYGLITIKPGPGGGPMVHTPRSHEFARTACFYFNVGGATLHDLLEARRLLEPLLARLAATSGDQTTIERLMVAVDAGEEARGTDDVGRWRGHAIDFHGLVAVASGNPILGLFGQSLRDVFNERVAERVMGTEDRAAVGREHRAIAAAIAAGQPDVAERLMAAHMNRFIEIAVQVIEGLLGDVLDWR